MKKTLYTLMAHWVVAIEIYYFTERGLKSLSQGKLATLKQYFPVCSL